MGREVPYKWVERSHLSVHVPSSPGLKNGPNSPGPKWFWAKEARNNSENNIPYVKTCIHTKETHNLPRELLLSIR